MTTPASAPSASAPRGARLGTALFWWPLGGAVMGASFVRDGLEWLIVPGFAVWLVAIAARPPRLLLRGWLGGVAYVLVSLSWMVRPSVFILLPTALYFGFYIGPLVVFIGRLRAARLVPDWLVAPLGIYTMEVLLEHVSLLPVTWLHFGNLAWRVPALLQVAELGGIQVVSFELALLSAGLAELVLAVGAAGRGGLARARSWLPLGLGLAAFGATGLYGVLRLGALELEDGPRVALVQGNVPQSIRSLRQNAASVVARHLSLSHEGRGADLVAWPESTVMFALEHDAAMRELVGGLARELDAHLLIGAIGTNEPPAPPSNSAFLVAPSGAIVGRQDKRILVPFAETLPIVRHIPPLRDAIGAFLSRTLHFRPHLTEGPAAVALEAGRFKVAMICYGDTVPGPAADSSEAGVDVLVTLSNEAWFGDRELDQHLAMASVRSVETRLPLARVTNTGLTAIIDPGGRVTARAPRNRDAVLVGTLRIARTWVVPAWLRHAVRCGVAAASLGLFVRASLRLRRAGGCGGV